ncbi:acyl-CoA carboxylase epsilon subunit [Streptomyces lanatus]|uniref:Acyl-CoA carboxylase epsilon subunit n=1 Tax=Streptomyces lanatus TaxID=66900 RepID=A0ABV1Y654_9ACTN|nr:acyl-CoA carboxylase epsilon subunit [Streptomyces lanatus]GHH30539.1 hypothetical protein GCM10018780_90080 [Streptomyces lanatus]
MNLRIDYGTPDADELAALTAVLLALSEAPAHDTDTDGRPHIARWRRPERMSGHRTPRSWRSATVRTSGWAA